MTLEIVKIDNPSRIIVMLGKLHVNRTADDIQETLLHQIQDIRFGMAYYESSGCSGIGTDNSLIETAKIHAGNLRVEKLFVLFAEHTNPKKVLTAFKRVEEINEIYCATSENAEIIITHNNQARAIMGVADDYSRNFIKEAGIGTS
jgi:adenosine/AMP kinase